MKKYLLPTLFALSLTTACSPAGVNAVVDALASSKPTTPTASSSPSTPASTVPSAQPGPGTVPLSDMAAAIDAFRTEFDTAGKTYQGSIKMLFKALSMIETDPALAEHLVTLCLNGKQMYEDAKSPTGYDIGSTTRYMLTEMKNKPEVVRSYIGGTVEKNYADYDKVNLPLNFPLNGTMINGLRVDNTIEAEGATKGRVYIQSAGKDFPTPITLEQNAKGLWKINTSDLSSIATGVKKPVKTDF